VIERDIEQFHTRLARRVEESCRAGVQERSKLSHPLPCVFDPQFPRAGNADEHIVGRIDERRPRLVAEILRRSLGPYEHMRVEENSH